MLFIAAACAILAVATNVQTMMLPAYGAATNTLVAYGSSSPTSRPSACTPKTQIWGGYTYSSGAAVSTPSSTTITVAIVTTSTASVGGFGGSVPSSSWTTAPSPHASNTMVFPAEGGVVQSAPAVASGGYALPSAGNSTGMPTLGGYQPAASGGSGLMQATNAGAAVRPGVWMTAASILVAGAVMLS